MPLAITYSRANLGIDAPLVTVETHISNGLPALRIVGLPETAVKESKERVRSAILNTHYEFPSERITINLAPANLRKEGGRFDLAIALGILAASEQIDAATLLAYEFAGELALNGNLRAVDGILSFALAAKKAQRKLITPEANAAEAALAGEAPYTANHLLDVCAHLKEGIELTQYSGLPLPALKNSLPELQDVRGQHLAKRALEIAAAGQHSLLFVGPPGTGKTLLSSCLPSILPPLTQEEKIEVALIKSFAGKSFQVQEWHQRPFRNPHHTASCCALVGGGNPPIPGEISLAHLGVLFLDELPEFKRSVLEALREPLESGNIIISRKGHQLEIPARFQLIAAMNPCPCGYFKSQVNECRCSPDQVKRYHTKISGPLLDRIDLSIPVAEQPQNNFLTSNQLAESSHSIQQRVIAARTVQAQRQNKTNAYLTNKEIEQYCQLSQSDQKMLVELAHTLKLSMRAQHKILKIARTIADLAEEKDITFDFLKEATAYRNKL